MVKVLYFSWIRERIGVSKETIETDASRVNELIGELKSRDERYNLAFSQPSTVCVAVDQELGNLDSDISNASEIAFFPPMTGG